MKETLSVIIPALNEEQNIGDCLESLLNQTEKPLEIIVVDNGSTDNTKDIAKKFKKKFRKKRIQFKLFSCLNGNQTNARDFGIKKSKGTIIGSLDADAFANKNWIFKIMKNFKTQEIVGVGGKSRFRNKGKIFNFLYSLTYYFSLLSGLYCLGGNNSAFRKSYFLSVNGYSGLEELRKKEKITHAKDDFFLSKKLEQKGKLKFCPDLNVTLQHRIRNNHTRRLPTKFSIKEVVKRTFLEINYDLKITKYFKKKHLKKN